MVVVLDKNIMIELTSINPSEMLDSEIQIVYTELNLIKNCGLDRLMVKVKGKVVYIGINKISNYK